jgi:hypothetical protein
MNTACLLTGVAPLDMLVGYVFVALGIGLPSVIDALKSLAQQAKEAEGRRSVLHLDMLRCMMMR